MYFGQHVKGLGRVKVAQGPNPNDYVIVVLGPVKVLNGSEILLDRVRTMLKHFF